MKTLFEIHTKGDAMTLPGGIALRVSDSGSKLIVHNFNTDRDTGTTREYWQGSYFHTDGEAAKAFTDALTEMARRADRAGQYDQGGSIDLASTFGLESVN